MNNDLSDLNKPVQTKFKEIRKYFFRASNKDGGYFTGEIIATSEKLFKQKFKKQFPLCKLWRFNSEKTNDKLDKIL